MLQADDGTMCVKAGALEVPATLTDAVGAEAQGQLSWRVLDAKAGDVVSLQGFDRALTEVITSDSQGGGWIRGSGS